MAISFPWVWQPGAHFEQHLKIIFLINNELLWCTIKTKKFHSLKNVPLYLAQNCYRALYNSALPSFLVSYNKVNIFQTVTLAIVFLILIIKERPLLTH